MHEVAKKINRNWIGGRKTEMMRVAFKKLSFDSQINFFINFIVDMERGGELSEAMT